MVDLIGLRQRAGEWKIVASTCPVIGFDWQKIRSECRDVTGPSLYEDLAAVFQRDDLRALATTNAARDWIAGPGADAEIFVVILAENLES